ncbi:UNVERIFIED_CONTAM: hypothetical protein GTU68_019701 [Idotea baltica]|nr:hypothetical protein [Idotea baltica]
MRSSWAIVQAIYIGAFVLTGPICWLPKMVQRKRI